MGFVRRKITKLADKMAATYQFASIRCCGHSNLVIFIRISSKFHIWFASIKLCFKFEYDFCPTNNNQDGRQNGRRLLVCIRPLLWSLLVVFNRISSKFHIYGLLPSNSVSSLNMIFVRRIITKMADKMAAAY